jgi:chaperonin cofactor prefoldin
MDVVHFLRARLAIERDELDQLTSGSVRIHRRTGDGRFVDETEQSIARVKQLIDTLENQIRHFERQESSQQANR